MHTITIIIGPGESGGLNSAEIRGWITLLAAISAAIFAYRALRRESRRDRIADETRLKEQARKFSAWFTYENQVTSRGDITGASVTVKNASELPIENVIAWFWYGTRHEDVPFAQVAAGNDPIIVFGTVPPRAERCQIQHYDVAKLGLNLSLTFSDQQGNRWVRHGGLLERETSAHHPTYVKEVKWQAPRYLKAARVRVTLLKGQSRSFRDSVSAVIMRALGFKSES